MKAWLRPPHGSSLSVRPPLGQLEHAVAGRVGDEQVPGSVDGETAGAVEQLDHELRCVQVDYEYLVIGVYSLTKTLPCASTAMPPIWKSCSIGMAVWSMKPAASLTTRFPSPT